MGLQVQNEQSSFENFKEQITRPPQTLSRGEE